jgi:hypothetical protein
MTRAAPATILRTTDGTVLQAHPRLTRKADLAAIEFGAQALRADVIYPVPAT